MNSIEVANRLDPCQARRHVGPDLGPNCKGYKQRALAGGELRETSRP